MADLVVRTQSLFQPVSDTLSALPFWMAIGLLFVPTLVALFTQNGMTMASTVLLNVACLLSLTAGQSTNAAVPVAIVAFAASLLVALYGLRNHQFGQSLSDLEARVGHIDAQMAAFLEALERRSDMIDQRAEEARKIFEEMRKVPASPRTAFPPFPSASQVSAPGRAPHSTPGPETTAAATDPAPPKPEP